MGQSWATYLHIETDRLNWGNNVPVHLRDLVNPLPPPVEPKPTVLFDPAKGVWGLYPLNKNKLTIREVTHTAADEAEALCLYLQWVLRLKASQNIKPDGDFGPSTGDAVERFQTFPWPPRRSGGRPADVGVDRPAGVTLTCPARSRPR